MKAYMDYGSGSPVDPRVLNAMVPYFSEYYGNPSSVHSYAFKAQEALTGSRKTLASLIGAKSPEEIIFTSGATESNNLALKGVALRNKDKGNRIVTTAVEHISTVNICKALSKDGFTTQFVPVDQYGSVDLDKLSQAIDQDTMLVSVIYASSEIGTIQPMAEIGKIAEEKQVPLHVDATAAAGTIPLDVVRDNVSLMTISSNDMRGPKGVGALYVRGDVKISAVNQGGGQERGLRSGSENVPGVVGMAEAARIALEEMESEGVRLADLRDGLISGVLDSVPESFLNGHATMRLPNNANVRFSYIEGEALLLSLDSLGIQASTGSACTSKTLEPSHILLAIGLKHEEAHGSLLFTLGKENRKQEVDYVVRSVPPIVRRLRSLSPLTPKELLK